MTNRSQDILGREKRPFRRQSVATIMLAKTKSFQVRFIECYFMAEVRVFYEYAAGQLNY